MQQRVEKFQSSELQDYLDSSNTFYQDLIGYKPEQTSFQQVPEAKWNEFMQKRGLNPNSSGIYLPKNQTAVIQGENPLNLFYHYFGHGLYCEQSLSGRELVSLEKRLLEEEKQKFEGRQPTLEEMQDFRQTTKTFHNLKEFRRRNLRTYERFAIFTEFLLSGEFGLNHEFKKKYDSLSDRDRETADSVINFNKKYGNLATFYAQGLARRTTPERTKRLLEEVYGDKLKNIKFALLYGSKKEFSDIDVFVVSDNLDEFCEDWLDINVVSQQDFEEGVSLFDIEVSDPLVTGDLIIGDKAYFENFRERLTKQQITGEAIEYNRLQIKEQMELTQDYEAIKTGHPYTQYYLANYLALKEGFKLFTREALGLYLEERTIGKSEQNI